MSVVGMFEGLKTLLSVFFVRDAIASLTNIVVSLGIESKSYLEVLPS